MKGYRLEKNTVKTVRKYLETKNSMIIPVGIIEQHGYHLPLETDALLAKHFSRQLAERCEILTTPVVWQSYSGGQLPGTINYSPNTMAMVIGDLLSSLATQGFKKFYILLCHGGSENIRALDNALKILLRENPIFNDVMIDFMPVWKFNSEGIGWNVALKSNDWHAGWLETSMALAFEPESVYMDEMELDEQPILDEMRNHPDMYQGAAKIIDDECVVAKHFQRDEVKVGIMGYPEKACAKKGQEIIDDILKNMESKISELEKKYDGIYKRVKFQPEPIAL